MVADKFTAETVETDLLGDPLVIEPATGKPAIRRRKPGTRAYPALPGSGPADKQCRDCAHYRSVRGGVRSYPKCALMQARWSHGPATDIRAKSTACSKFEAP